VVWTLILVTHAAFRYRRSQLGLPASPVRLAGAPITSGIAALCLVAVLVSTFFVEGLDPAWQFGIPFFAVLLIAFAIVQRRRQTPAEDPLAAELDDRTADEVPTI